MPETSQATKKLISRYKDWYYSLQPKEGIPTVHVDEVASKVAAFYERMRGVIDWREEHLLRRSAIERILKRRLFLKQEGRDLAAPFVQELIRGGYFPNDRIEEEKIGLVQRMIEKYVFLFQNSGSAPAQKGKIQLYDWLISIAACETEEILDPPRRERAIIDYMEELMEERITAPAGISSEEKCTQVLIAVQKSLFKLDKAIIVYHLLKKRFPRWMDLSGAELENIAKNIYSLWNNLERDFKHPLAEKFYRICEKHDTPYLILGDIFSEDPPKIEEKLNKPELLETLIAEIYHKRLKKLKSRIKRAAFYSTVSIFFTKILLALAVEIPFDKYFTKQIDYETVGLSVFIPSFLMFLLVSTIRSPGKSNLQKVVIETIKIVYRSEKTDVYLIKSPKKRGVILNIVLTLLYSATFALSLGVIWFGLSWLKFGLLSKIIFLIFFSLISFAGVKLRERAKELTIEEEKGGFISFFLDSFSLPFITMGKWLSSQWTKYNIVIVLITALIDLPLQFFTEFLEQWRNFLKEKKEEIH